MSLLDFDQLLQEYSTQSGLLGPNGQIAAPPAPQKPKGILDSPGFSQALLNLGATLAQASHRGYGTGAGLALGAQQFGSTMQSEGDRIKEAEKQATQERLAGLKDLYGLRMSREELALRMQDASLRRQSLQNTISQQNSEAEDKAKRAAAIQAMAAQNPELAQAYNMFGEDAAQTLYLDSQKPKERKIIQQGDIQYYADTGEPVLSGVSAPPPKLTEAQTKNNNLAQESLTNYGTAIDLLYDESGNVDKGKIGPVDKLYGKGRTMDQALDRAIQNTVYLKTGQAAPPSELKSLREQYKPSVFDNAEQIKNKEQSLKQFIEANIPAGYRAKKPDATGGFDPALMQFMTPEERALFQ